MVILLARLSFSAPDRKEEPFKTDQKEKTLLNVTYLSNVTIAGGQSIEQKKGSKTIRPPKDGSFGAKYQFSQLALPNSSRKEEFPKR